jgi:hypothetical protein
MFSFAHYLFFCLALLVLEIMLSYFFLSMAEGMKFCIFSFASCVLIV